MLEMFEKAFSTSFKPNRASFELHSRSNFSIVTFVSCNSFDVLVKTEKKITARSSRLRVLCQRVQKSFEANCLTNFCKNVRNRRVGGMRGAQNVFD